MYTPASSVAGGGRSAAGDRRGRQVEALAFSFVTTTYDRVAVTYRLMLHFAVAAHDGSADVGAC